MNVRNFRGDLTDISAEKAALDTNNDVVFKIKACHLWDTFIL